MTTTQEMMDALGDAASALERARFAIVAQQQLLALAASDPVECVLLGVLGCALDVGELQTRADSMLALIDSLERFVSQTLPVGEAAAVSGDVARVNAVLKAAANILEAVQSVTPLGDLALDVRQFVDDVTSSIVPTLSTTAILIALLGVGILAATR